MRDSTPDFTKRRKIAAIACISALVLLVMHSRCTSSPVVESIDTMTEKSVTVETRNTEARDRGNQGEEREPVSPELVTASAADIPPLPETERVLIVGMDRTGKLPGRTDGMMVAEFDYRAGRVGVVSVPRDLYVDIPGLEPGRINTVLRAGTRALGPERGQALLKKVVGQNLGLGIDYLAAADFGGFVAAVDALGGVRVTVECPIEDCFWTGGETCERLSLSEGTHRLDGRTALLFARSRHGRTDLDRGRRQQAVLMGLKSRLIQPSTLLRLPRLFETLSAHVDTDMPLDAAVRMGALVHRVGSENIHGLVMRAPVIESRTTPDKKSVLVLNKPLWHRALANLYTAAPPGARTRGTCPAADVGLNWRERKQKFEEKHHAANVLPTRN